MLQFNNEKSSGFIHLIILIIAFVLIAFYFKKDPIAIWEAIKPFFIFLLDLFVKMIDFIIKTIVKLLSK